MHMVSDQLQLLLVALLPLQQLVRAAAAAGGAARVEECGSGPPALQRWQMGEPQAGFIYNPGSRQCLNVAGCQTDVIFDVCALAPKQTCGGAGLHGQPNEEFTLNGSRLISALPGGSTGSCVSLFLVAQTVRTVTMVPAVPARQIMLGCTTA